MRKHINLCVKVALWGGVSCSFLAPAAHSQNATTSGLGMLDFNRSSDGQSAPSTLLLKNLTSEWRRVNIEIKDDNSNPYAYAGVSSAIYRDALTDMGIGVYFTKGQSVQLGDGVYLVAYRIQNDPTPQEIQDVMRTLFGGRNRGAQTGPQKFAPDTKLAFSLLNMKAVSSLSDVRPFSAQNDIMGPADVIAASDRNLARLGSYLIQLNSNSRNYGFDGRQIRDETTLRQLMVSYFHAPDSVFVQPQDKERYRFNRALLGKNLSRIGNAARLVAFYEAKPGTDGKRGAVFLSGQTQRVPVAKWLPLINIPVQGVPESQLRAMSQNNLLRIGYFLKRYTRTRNGLLPPMTTPTAARKALISLVGYNNLNLFAEPKTNRLYGVNAAVSGKKLAEIANAAELVAFYEPQIGSDQKIGVLYLDGHVGRVAAAQLKRSMATRVQIKKASHSA